MVGTETYKILLQKCINNCTGFNGRFISRKKFHDIYERIRRIGSHVRDSEYRKVESGKSEDLRDGVLGIPYEVLNLEGELLSEDIRRE